MARTIAVIGAGAVGATLAQRILESDTGDVILVDILKNVAAGKALDLLDAAPIVGHERRIIGTDNYEAIAGCEIVVITAGLPRKPGMTREDLIAKNASIVREVSKNIATHAPDALVIIVTNPLDVMTYLAHKTTGFARQRVIGMAGVLDGARMMQLIADALSVPRSSVETVILGSHGDTMVPLLSHTRVNGKELSKVLAAEKVDAIVKRTRDRGAEIVSLLGSGSAYYSPSAAVHRMIESILNDKKDVLAASVVLEGEYGLRDLAIGVPCVIGKSGVEKIEEIELTADERRSLQQSAAVVKSSLALL